MQNEILRISGQEVDIIPNSIDRKIQINDLGSAESRESSYSQTIKLPRTSRNQMVLGFLGVPGAVSRAPYTKLSADYIVDGIPLIVNGFTEIKATKQHYEVVIYDGVIDLAEKLKGKTLSDLDYSDLNHYLSAQNYTNSFSNTAGYIYALGRFMDDGMSAIKIERQVPSVYSHTLWSKIFSELGINYFGDFFNKNLDFRTEVVTPPQGYEVQDIEPTISPIGTYSMTSVYHNETSQDYIFEADETFGFSTTFTSSDITFGSDNRLIFNATGSFEISIDLNYRSTDGYNTFNAVFNGRVVKTFHLEPTGSAAVIKLNLSVESGDELYLKINGSNTGFSSQEPDTQDLQQIGDSYTVNYTADALISFSEVSGGFLVDFNKIMGNMGQIDFIKDVMQRYGLILKPMRGTNDYEFIQFESLLNDRRAADDWTSKLSTIDGEEYGTKYAKRNKAEYNYHEDIKIPTHNGILSINNENAEPEKSLFKSPYQIPIEGIKYRQQPMYLHPVWEKTEEDGATVIKVKESKIKTFRINRINDTMSARYFNDTNSVSFTGEIPFLSLNNMELQYFLNVYYKGYKLTVNSYKEVDAVFNLNLMDVYDLDLFKLKYLRQTGKFYYLNSLQHNAGGKASKGKLIEISEFSSNSPVNVLGSYTMNLSYGDTKGVSIKYLTTSSDPAYFDPENDAPYKVKFIDGSATNIKLYQNGVEITAGQEILVSDWNVTAEDIKSSTSSHQATFEYQIMDTGSESYGTQVGTLTINVREYNNTAPFANAGADRVLNIDSTLDPNIIAQLDGSGSHDYTGSITYSWIITAKPLNSRAYITNTTQEVSALSIPQDSNSVGSYTIQLTVTDEFGLSDTDTMTVTVTEVNGGFQPA